MYTSTTLIVRAANGAASASSDGNPLSEIAVALVVILVTLLIVAVGGGILTALVVAISRFLNRNRPSAAVMAAFNAAEAARLAGTRDRKHMTEDSKQTEADELDDIPASGTDKVYAALGRYSGYVALLAAWIATCGSLYFSEVLGWTPCLLCWYQRILMYPLSLLLAVGLLRRDKGLHKYALVLSIPGACVSLFHYLDQKTDLVSAFVPCKVGIPCSADYLNAFGGVVTIPFLALIAFLIITFSMVASRLGAEPEDETEEPRQVKQPTRIATALPVFAIILAVVLAFAIAAINYRNAAAGSVPDPTAISEVPLPTPDSNAAARGKVLFESACAACHGIDGKGTPAGLNLTTSQLVRSGSDAELVKFVRMGRSAQDPHNITGMTMPANGGRSDASDQEIVSVIVYLRQLAKNANAGS
ncbi:MAG: disulfide oxidoreductase [Chloroflexi bacterium]|nr:disulfide oxidoreductase [Chloroflexota bacterium]MCL5275854.1 disulfide oxidoreductase [Chloroflexota bacterium]